MTDETEAPAHIGRPTVVFMHGVRMGADDYASFAAVRVRYDGDSLTITKGPALAGWLADETPVRVKDAEESMPMNAANMQEFQNFMAHWLRGEDWED
jgi:hypothetical protein